MSEFEAILLLVDDKYTIENIRQKRSITSYVQIVIRHAKNVDFNTTHTQLNWVWNHLAFDLQRNISMFNVNTNKLNFIKQLKVIQQV